MANLSGINLNNGASAVGSKSEGMDSPSHSLALMPRYEAYKDSGVEWLGDIPSSWELKPGFVAFRESKSNNKGMKENTVLSLSYGNIVIKPEEKLVGLAPESFETYQLVEPDDIIVRCTDLQNDKVSLRTGLAKNKGIITNAYLNLRVKNGFDARFLHYYLHALDTTKVLYKYGSGLRQNLSFLDFKRLPIFEIPEDTQKLIANYLDKKTAQIDDAIAIKKQQISLLKERKQIIIQQAVTQGLDPNVPMKDSGVDWIGNIPEHWEVLANRTLFSERVEPGKNGLPLLSVSIHTGVSSEEVSEVDNIRGRVKIEDKTKYIIVKPGDIAFNMMRAWQGGIGAVTIDGMVSPAYIVAKPRGAIVAEFFEYQYRCSEFIQQMDRYSKGITDFRKRLYWDSFKQLLTVVPPEPEQVEIIRYIKGVTISAEAGIGLLNSQIEKLKEYKTTLINSAVTGKIKITPEMVEQ